MGDSTAKMYAARRSGRVGTRPVSPVVLATLIHNRKFGWLSGAFIIVQVTCTALGVPAWRCPFREWLGAQCPGCGLSRAVVALFRGDWWGSVAFHPLAIPLLLGAVLVCTSSVLPERLRRGLEGRVRAVEERTAVAVLVLAAVMGFGAARMVMGAG
jgi:hypothetical protein